jgi:hypothetical protein
VRISDNDGDVHQSVEYQGEFEKLEEKNVHVKSQKYKGIKINWICFFLFFVCAILRKTLLNGPPK